MAKKTTEKSEATQNAGLLLLSLVLALASWAAVKQRATGEKELNVRIVPKNLPATVELKLDPETIPVTFTFPRRNERFLTSENFQVELDLEGIELKENITRGLEQRERIEIGDVQPHAEMEIPRSIVAISFPRTNRVTWTARLLTATARIEPVIEGQPATGFIWRPDDVSVEPKEITVAVTRQFHEQLQLRGGTVPTIRTQPFSIAGRADVVDGTVVLQYPAGLAPFPPAPVLSVSITVPVQEEQVERRITGVPVEYQLLRRNVTARTDPSTIDVLVSGPKSQVEPITASAILVSALGASEEPGRSSEVRLRVSLREPPANATRIQVEPDPKVAMVTIEELATPTPSPTATPAPTTAPSPSPTPTATPEPTATPMPSPSPSPEPMPTAAVDDRETTGTAPTPTPTLEELPDPWPFPKPARP